MAYLLVTNDGNKRVNVFLGNGDGTFSQTQSLVVGDNPTPITTGDLDSDGNIDLVVINEDDNNTSIFLGNGDGTFAVGQTLSVGSNTMVPAVLGNLNGDAHVDLVITDRTAPGKVTILLGNGDGTFSFSETLTVGTIPHTPILEDLDFDGNADLVVGSNNEVQFFYGNGDGTFEAAVTVSVGNLIFDTKRADFNGDGFLDVVSNSSLANELTILLADTELRSDPENDIDLVVGDLNVTTQSQSENSLLLIDAAIETLTLMQASVGTQIHRLDHVRVGNLLRNETITRAQEDLLSTDFALEVAELVRHQILESAQTSVLAQANTQTQMVLNLLNFN